MVLTAILIVLGVAALILTTTTTTSVSITNRQADQTAKALAGVKTALIGWSAARDPATDGVNARPGELPCPDINPLDGYEDGSCVAGALGRVPWKTLGIPEPKDAAGETLWYTIAGPFRAYNPSIPLTTVPITSDTVGNITFYQDNRSTTLTTPASTATTITTEAIAVIFAPGAALGTQDRSLTTTMACTAPSGTFTRNLCASNYLETWSSVNNATINGPFIKARSSDRFNDRLLVLTNVDLMPAVEQRVAREMMSILDRYRSATGSDYPFADVRDGDTNKNYNRHRFPCGNASTSSPNSPSWSGAGITLPNWLTNGCGSNGWASLIFYAVAKNRLPGNSCSTCASSPSGYCLGTTTSSNYLTVVNPNSRPADLCIRGSSPFTCTPTVISSDSNYELVLITPGAKTNSRTPWSSSLSTISGYFEDSQNTNNNDYNCYVVPTSTAYDRDRMYVVQ